MRGPSPVPDREHAPGLAQCPEPATPSRAPTLRLTAVGVRWPSELREGAGLAGEGHVVVQEAAAARKAVFRGAASHLRIEEWARRSGPAHSDPLPSLPPNSTHQACVSAPQRHDGASKARSQSPVAGQQPVDVRRGAHCVATQHVDGLVQAVLHLVLLQAGEGQRSRVQAPGALLGPGVRHTT